MRKGSWKTRWLIIWAFTVCFSLTLRIILYSALQVGQKSTVCKILRTRLSSWLLHTVWCPFQVLAVILLRASVWPGPKVLPHPSVTWPLYLPQAISRTNIFVFQPKGIPIITGTQESQWSGSVKFQPKTTGHTFTVLSSQYVAVEAALRNRLTFWSEAQHTLTHHLWHWYPRSAWSERIQTFLLGNISYMIHYVFFFLN